MEQRIAVYPYLEVDLVHGGEITGEIGEEDVAFNNSSTVNPSSFQDLGHVVERSALNREASKITALYVKHTTRTV